MTVLWAVDIKYQDGTEETVHGTLNYITETVERNETLITKIIIRPIRKSA